MLDIVTLKVKSTRLLLKEGIFLRVETDLLSNDELIWMSDC